MKKIRAVILANENSDDHNLWVKACEAFKDQIEFQIVDLTKNTWLDSIHSQQIDILLAKPGGVTSLFKQLYDERIYILSTILNYRVFPSPDEIYFYENKRFLSYWLKACKIPHPETNVFYHQKEAAAYLHSTHFPIVAKTNIGASGSGVKILMTTLEVEKYISQTFKGKGAPKRIGPNFNIGGILKRAYQYFLNPAKISNKLEIYRSQKSDPHFGYVIFQEYIPHDFEWRAVRIGNSFFAHKKLKLGEKASGSLLKGYDTPPIELLDFIKRITDQHKLLSIAIDLFETQTGYLVNEMQCIFGQSDPYQMLVDGKPGRYLSIDNKWIFEEGVFNKNESFNLRIEYVCSLFNVKG